MNNTANDPQAAEKNSERNLRNKQLAIHAQNGSDKAMRELLKENEEFHFSIIDDNTIKLEEDLECLFRETLFEK